jgi:large subunit ribosomal protein L4
MKCAVKTIENKEAGEVTLPEAIFGLTPIRNDIIARVINWQMAKRQAGTHKTKQIGDVSGRKGKPYAQKGTGRARQGSLRSPQFRGGAIIFGPVVRSHAFSLNKKIRTLGLRMALSAKQAQGKIIVLDSDNLKEGKTATLRASFEKMGLKSALIIGGETINENFKNAASNIPLIDVLPQAGINVYDILRRDTLVLTKDAIEHLGKRLGSEKKPAKKASTKKSAPKAKAVIKLFVLINAK